MMNARKVRAFLLILGLPLVLSLRLAGQSQRENQSQKPKQNPGDMSGMDMSKMNHPQHEASANPDAARSATESMSHEHMDMGPHMYMTALRTANDSDEKRADQILATLRPAIEKYRNYRTAIADGYQIFLLNLPQPQYHFTNWRYAFEAEFVFNPEHPTSLIYKKTSRGYDLVGAMYTAPKRDTEEQLNDRVPLSVARWHKHINFCMPPKGVPWFQTDWKKFGMGGSIATEDACNEAGGRWTPQMFGWMVHVSPFESDPQKVWAH